LRSDSRDPGREAPTGWHFGVWFCRRQWGAFGWQNSHLHEFTLPKKRKKRLAGERLEDWARMVGRVFRSPLMDENAPFWADDYEEGSFKFWLRRKYTGPYRSGNWGEEYPQCLRDMERLEKNALQYVLLSPVPQAMREEFDGAYFVRRVVPVVDYRGDRNPPPKPYDGETGCQFEIVRLGDVPVSGLWNVFDVEPFALLERRLVASVLASGRAALPQDCSQSEKEEIEQRIEASCRDLLARPVRHSDAVQQEFERWGWCLRTLWSLLPMSYSITTTSGTAGGCGSQQATTVPTLSRAGAFRRRNSSGKRQVQGEISAGSPCA